MQQDKAGWNTKQTVASKIVKQLQGKSEEEQKQFILKLLDHIDDTFLMALEFAYDITPEPEHKTDSQE